MINKITIIVFALLCTFKALAVDISGTINSYVKGSGDVVTGATTIVHIGTFRGAGSSISAGDTLLLIQSQGASIDSSNTDKYGDGVGPGNAMTTTPTSLHGTDDYAGGLISQTAGTFEYVEVLSVLGSTVTLTTGLAHDYYDANEANWQIIVIPDYSTAGATITGTLTGEFWDGDTGGVIAFNATGGSVDFNGNTINATGIGFRGGVESDPGWSTDNVASVADVGGDTGGKGEGIAGTPQKIYNGSGVVDEGSSTLPGGDFSRGAPGNAGGGAGPTNSGGGGGSNAGSGGSGAQGWASTAVHFGGYGGQSIYAGANMGGGGGSGEANNNVTAYGGLGGGVVMIRANTATGSGDVNAKGTDGLDVVGTGSGEDGGGGGGAGGAIIIYFNAVPNLPGLTASASGGNGSDGYFNHGGGGGGGSGLVAIKADVGSIVAAGGIKGANKGPGSSVAAESGNSAVASTGANAFISLNTDYGDAPSSYDTISGGLGAYHTFQDNDFDGVIDPNEAIFLGAALDGEAGGNPSVAANSDDLSGDDEDGITNLADINPSATGYVINSSDIFITNQLGASSTLHAWLDFDNNGAFDSDEYASISVADGLANQNPASGLTWGSAPGLSSATQGSTTYLRFRLTSDSDITAASATGVADNGEVEDYAITILDVSPNVTDITRSDPASASTNANELEFNITFSESVQNVGAADFSVSGAGSVGASITAVAGSGNSYTVTVNVDNAGTGEVNLNVTSVTGIQDLVGNDLASVTQTGDDQIYTLDNTASTVAIQNVPANSNAPFTATFEFNEDVTGFVVGDIDLGNATASNFIAVDGNTYTALITPTGGAVTVDVASNAANDAASNGNTAATQATSTYDTTAPTVAIQNVPVNSNAPFTATFEFNEDVTGFVVGDIDLGNATASNFNAVDGNTYTALITPTGGAVTVDVASNVANDAASNGNTAATQATSTYDTTAPTVAIQDVPANSNAPFTATFEFSEDVTGFVVGDISLGNATASNFNAVDGNTYTALITPTGGAVTVDVASNAANDAASNGNTAATQATSTYDTTAPTVAIQDVPANSNAPFTATFEFSEDVTGFVVGDISLGNATASNFNAVDGNTYTALITPSGGAVTVDVASNVANNAASNGNSAATQATSTYDVTEPTVVIQNAPGTVNNTDSYTVTAQFSESVSTFVVTDITLVNAAISNFTSVDGDTYTFDVTPDGEGNVAINIAANVAQDIAGNLNAMASQVVTIIDTDGDGIDDETEGNGDGDGDGIPDYLDISADEDNDGIPDIIEGMIDTDDDGIIDALDTDSDNDGISDTLESGASGIDTDNDGIDDVFDVDQTGGTDANSDGIDDAIILVDTDKDRTPDYRDTDSDNDGILDVHEGTLDSDGDGQANYIDTDSDGDGTSDSLEGVGDTDDDGISDYIDLDSDNDGLPDSLEQSVNLSGKDTDGDGIDDNYDVDQTGGTDSNNDGVDDTIFIDTDSDGIPNFLDPDSDGDGIPDLLETGLSDVDSDDDGIVDSLDVDETGGTDANGDGIDDAKNANDSDRDGIPDYLDSDSDNDGASDTSESQVTLTSDGTTNVIDDADGDGIADVFDADFTGGIDANSDGIDDGISIQDTDNDGINDSLDLDSDNDGILDVTELGLLDQNSDGAADAGQATLNELPDTDNDGTPDLRDLNSALDGSFDIDGSVIGVLDANNDGMIDDITDSDGDGIVDVIDGEPDQPGTSIDTDADGVPSPLDRDDDGDGIADSRETDDDNDNDGISNRLDRDSDGDGIPDRFEANRPLATGIDSDLDGIDDAFDVDISGGVDADNDGIDDALIETDIDNDGLPDYLDTDTDGDGIPDNIEQMLLAPSGNDIDFDGIDDAYDVDVTGGTDANNDGIDDAVLDLSDMDGDGILNFRDLDSDGDGYPDADENGDYNNDGVPDYTQEDAGFKTGLSGSGSFNFTSLFGLMLLALVRLRGRFKKYLMLSLSIVLSLLFVSTNIHAQDSICQQDDELNIEFDGCVYGGLGIGLSILQPEGNNTGWDLVDENDIGYKAAIGYRFLPQWYTEFSYANLGEARIKNLNPAIKGKEGISYKVPSLNLGYYLFSKEEQRWNVFIKGGISSIHNSASSARVPFKKVKSNQFSFGLGAEYQLTPRFFVRAEVDSYDTDATQFVLSLNTYFGSRSKKITPTREELVEEPQPVDPVPVEKIVEPLPVEKFVGPVIEEVVVKDTDQDGILGDVDECINTPLGVSVNELACAVLEMDLKGVQFELNSSDLTADSETLLDEVATSLVQYTDIRLEVQAHTDDRGSKGYNQRLSESRAQSVADYLISKGVSKERLVAKCYGEMNPSSTNDTAEGRSLNRRVEFVVIE
jgi:hypothetical protein